MNWQLSCYILWIYFVGMPWRSLFPTVSGTEIFLAQLQMRLIEEASKTSVDVRFQGQYANIKEQKLLTISQKETFCRRGRYFCSPLSVGVQNLWSVEYKIQCSLWWHFLVILTQYRYLVLKNCWVIHSVSPVQQHIYVAGSQLGGQYRDTWHY